MWPSLPKVLTKLWHQQGQTLVFLWKTREQWNTEGKAVSSDGAELGSSGIYTHVFISQECAIVWTSELL